jgi:predicted nucleic acid-binding protein
VTLTDAGPLLALLDRRDPYHELANSALSAFPKVPLLTTTPCFSEAMYMLGREGGHNYQGELWKLRSNGTLRLHELTPAELDRAAFLMEHYRNVPMDFGDASLVAVAETRGLRRVFTLDHHFWIYRPKDGSTFEAFPGGSPRAKQT